MGVVLLGRAGTRSARVRSRSVVATAPWSTLH